MPESSAPIASEKLREFLSTDMRKKLFFCYVFSRTSPSDVASITKTSISTVDMVTNTLRLMGLLKEAKGTEKNKNFYEINMETWFTDNLKVLGMDFVKEEQKKEILEIMGDKKFLALSFILTDPDFAMRLYEEPLKMGDDIVVFKLMKLFKRASLVSDFPSYVLVSVLIFPSFRQLKDNIFSERGLTETIKTIKDEASKYPFLANVLTDVDEEALKKYDEGRAALSRIMEQLIEQELQLLSTERAKRMVEAEQPIERPPILETLQKEERPPRTEEKPPAEKPAAKPITKAAVAKPAAKPAAKPVEKPAEPKKPSAEKRPAEEPEEAEAEKPEKEA